MARKQPFTLTIDISPDGETVETEVKGMKGSGCHAIQEAFAGLGTEVEHRRTREYSQRPPVAIGKHLRIGK